MWSETPPTEPGWYWVRNAEGLRPQVVQVVNDQLGTELRVWVMGGRNTTALAQLRVEWSGPVAPPA